MHGEASVGFLDMEPAGDDALHQQANYPLTVLRRSRFGIPQIRKVARESADQIIPARDGGAVIQNQRRRRRRGRSVNLNVTRSDNSDAIERRARRTFNVDRAVIGDGGTARGRGVVERDP